MTKIHHRKRDAHAHGNPPRSARRYGRKDRDSGTRDGNARLGMAGQHLRRVLRTTDLPASRYKVALYIEEHLLGWGRLWDYLSTQHIAEKVEVDRSTAWRSLRSLAALGVIELTRCEETGRQRIEIVVPEAELVEEHTPAGRRACRDGIGNVVAPVATQGLIGDDYLIGGDGNVIEEAKPVTTTAAPATTTQSGNTAELVTLLADTAEPDDVARAVTRIEAVAQAGDHLAAMLAEGERYRWPRQVADAVEARATDAARHRRYNRPTCEECQGAGMILLDLDPTQAMPCPTCRPGTAPPCAATSPPSSTAEPTPTIVSSPTPSRPPLQPLGSPRPELPSMQLADAAGIEQARRMLARPDPPVSTILATGSVSS